MTKPVTGSLPCVAGVVLIGCVTAVASGQTVTEAEKLPIPAHVEMQPWQVRRAAYDSLALRLRKGDFSASKDYDAVLTEFDTRPFSRTPIEELEMSPTGP